MKRKPLIQNRIGRFVAGLVPAAGLTFGLFLAMNQLIDVRDVELNERTFRPLVKLTPPDDQTVPDDVFVEPIALPKLIDTPPKLREVARLDGDEIRIDLIDFGVPQTTVLTTALESILAPVRLTDREIAIPVRAPVPEYPERALRAGLEGECEVAFSIDAAGRPFGASASCTHEVFERSSQKAVERALFATKVKNGVPIGQDQLVYPIQFTLNE